MVEGLTKSIHPVFVRLTPWKQIPAFSCPVWELYICLCHLFSSLSHDLVSVHVHYSFIFFQISEDLYQNFFWGCSLLAFTWTLSITCSHRVSLFSAILPSILSMKVKLICQLDYTIYQNYYF